MAYDENLADRVRDVLDRETPTSERKMFGGLVFMVEGNMCCGVGRDRLMLRVGADAHEAACQRPHAGPMEMSGKKMRGFIYVEPDGIAEDADLEDWVSEALDFVRTLPPK